MMKILYRASPFLWLKSNSWLLWFSFISLCDFFGKIRVILSSNQMQNWNQSRLCLPRFPCALGSLLVFTLSSDWLCKVFSFPCLAVGIILALPWQYSIKKHSIDWYISLFNANRLVSFEERGWIALILISKTTPFTIQQMASTHQKKKKDTNQCSIFTSFSVIRITQENSKVKAMITFQLYNF